MVSIVSLSPLLNGSANVIPVVYWESLAFLASGTSSDYLQFPLPHCYIPPLHFLTLCTSPPPHTPDPAPPPLIFPPPLLSLPGPCYHYPSMIIFFPFLSRTEAYTLCFPFILSCIWSVAILSFGANIHLSASTHDVCCFVTGLPPDDIF